MTPTQSHDEAEELVAMKDCEEWTRIEIPVFLGPIMMFKLSQDSERWIEESKYIMA